MTQVSLSLLHRDVSRAGFHLFDWGENAPLESLALRLGRPVASVPGRPPVDVLVPKTREDSQPGTLSFMHGTDAFPFHTETAHWRAPVDWVILKCVNPGAGSRPTLLIDGLNLGLEDAEIRRLTQSLMVVKNGSKSFLAPLVTRESERLSFRYDLACMKPASNGDKTALHLLGQGLMHATKTDITWKAGQCLIFDNRRMLHSRAGSSIADPDRRLERIYVVKMRSY